MWKLPEYNSERVNQALFGNPLQVLKKRKGFAFVSQPDGYRGWVDERFLSVVKKEYFRDFEKKCRHILAHTSARVYDSQGRPADPYLLYYGTRLLISRTGDGLVRFQLPLAAAKYLKRSVVAPIIQVRKEPVDAARLRKEALKFLGCPYLWGGVTPAGFDCSAFVRALFGRFGVDLPRDTKDQIRKGTEVKRESIRSGDLLFFKRHVAMAMGNLRYIHCSVGGGGVRVSSFDRAAEDYRQDLDIEFKQARRIL